MRITLIKPKIGRRADKDFLDGGRMEPLQLAVLAGLTPPRVEVRFHDDRFEDVPFDEPTDLAALTVETFTAARAYEIAGEYRKRGVPVVLGGMHPTLAPDEAAEHADAVCTGDAESTWPEVLRDAEHGALRPLYTGRTDRPQAGVVAADRSIFRGKRYLPVTLLQFSRGCVNGCHYCATGAYFGKKHHTRPPEEVLGEIRSQGRRVLFFVDDNFTADHERAKAFLRKLIPLKVTWVTQLGMDAADDPELLRLLRDSGCLGFVLGIESLVEENLRGLDKSRTRRIRGAFSDEIRRFQDHGFALWAAFTLGYDGDTKDSLEDMISFALRWKFPFAAFNVLMPYPGTPFHDRLRAEGRLLYDGKWWIHPDYRFNHAAFRPLHMSPEELTEIGLKARRAFNTPPQIARRFLNPRGGPHLLRKAWIIGRYALLFRREMYRKHGMALGRK